MTDTVGSIHQRSLSPDQPEDILLRAGGHAGSTANTRIQIDDGVERNRFEKAVLLGLFDLGFYLFRSLLQLAHVDHHDDQTDQENKAVYKDLFHRWV